MDNGDKDLELEPFFAYELCAVPSALIDEQSCLRKGNKSVLVKRLGVVELSAKPADTIIINVSQLFYHIVWPHGGSPSNMIASIQTQLSRYPCDSKKVVAFDKYRDVSTKDHERMRRAGEAIADYELSITSTLPKRDVIMKRKQNKRDLASVLSTFSRGENITIETADDDIYGRDEANITMICYFLEASSSGEDVIRVLSDGTDVFVLLVYWVFRAQLRCKVQMERWNGTILDINATCMELGPKCPQLLGMHVLSGCDSTSYLYGKGKISARNTLLSGNYPGLSEIVGEVGTTHEQLMEATTLFFISLYGQPQGTSMESV